MKCCLFKIAFWIVNRTFRYKDILEIASLITIIIVYVLYNQVLIIRLIPFLLMLVYLFKGILSLWYKLCFKEEFNIQISRFPTKIRGKSDFKSMKRRHFGQSIFIPKINQYELIEGFYEGIIQLKKGEYFTRTHEVIFISLLRELKRKQNIDLTGRINEWCQIKLNKYSGHIKIILEEERFVYDRSLTLPCKKIVNTKSNKYLILIDVR